MLKLLLIASSAVLLTSCTERTPSAGSETSSALCRAWGGSLPTRSTRDTEETKNEITDGYDAFELACPDFAYYLPE